MSWDMYAFAKKWFISVLLLLALAFIMSPISYMAHYFLLLWVMAGIAVLYRARNMRVEHISMWVKAVLVGVGLLSCLLSVLSIPLGLGNPPYSLDDFTFLLAGASLMVFTLAGFSPLVTPALIPIAVVLGYQVLGGSPAYWFRPLLAPTISTLMLILTAFGFNPVLEGDVISFATREGAVVGVSIVPDCTGIWSLIAYSVAVVMVLLLLPKIKAKGYLYITFGFLATYIVNIIRVTSIISVMYLFGSGWASEATHIHVGWIVFSLWMLLFWYVFFSRDFFERTGVPA